MSNFSSKIWIVIPANNEEKYLETVLTKVRAFTNNIIVVDDGSQDKTLSIAKKHAKHVLHHQVNLGKGAALKTGCDFAFNTKKATSVIVMDSDDQHDPAELPLFEKALQKNEIVFGVRGFQGMPKIRAIGNTLLSALVAILFGMYIPDILSGYKAFTQKAYQNIRWESSAYGVELEIAVRVAKTKTEYETVAIATIYHDLDRGMTLLDALGILAHIISWRISL
jgi:glycosyltransferase involved in cell wall biosynthesis